VNVLRSVMERNDLKQKLKDFGQWASANAAKYFSLFDYLSATGKGSKLPIDAWVAFSEVFLPEFIEVNGCVLVEECFNEKSQDYQRYVKEGLSKREIETWINNICLDGLFYDLPGETDQISSFLGEKIKLGWELKLKRDFPERKFQVVLQKDDDVSDLLITFYEDVGPNKSQS